jgi:archaellum component FlaF (FlaF/FlaG flagellin family)
MNWSVHQTLEDAAQSVHNQYTVITMKRGGKIISEDSVDVIFEGHAVKAKKAVYDFKGIKSLLVGMSGGKTLTIYFVASPAAKNFVSCVMSFWNNDSIGTNGLPALLEEVMQLKK